MSRLSFKFSGRSIKNIIEDECIKIPEHQRPEMWDKKRQSRLIETVMGGRPIPNLTLNFTIMDGKRIYWLEDGQQRYISLLKFRDNKISWNDKFFKDLTEDQRIQFLTYELPIITYENATRKEIIEIFDSLQSGMPLSPGHRFHARLDSPLVKYAIDRLLSPDKGFYARATAVWGEHSQKKDTKTKKSLMNAMAIVGGVVHGVEYITTSYDILGEMLDIPFDEVKADSRLDALLKVYEAADAQHPITLTDRKKQWNVGKLTGYILATLLTNGMPNDIATKWTEYIVNIRNGNDRLCILHANVPASRNWNSSRWRIGYENVFISRPNIESVEDIESDEE